MREPLDIWEIPPVQTWPRSPEGVESSESEDGPNNCVTTDGVTYYCVGRLVGRTQTALYRLSGTAIHPVAYFKEPDDAETFRSWLVALADVAQKAEAAR
jgi:hypothetical protein